MNTDDKFPSSNEDKSNSCRIENCSGFPIRILNTLNESDQPTKTVYETKLSLIKTTSDESSIKEAEIKDVKLVGNRLDVYELLFVDKVSLFPFSLSTLKKSNGSYPDKTVTSQEKKQMDLAFHFYKYTPPTSILKESFVETLKRTESIKNEDLIDCFFRNTKSYKEVNFTHIKTVLSYVSNYPAVWADRKDSFTYYLYSPGLEERKELVQAPNFEGTLKLERKEEIFSSPTFDLTKGYTITFEDKKGRSFPIKYDQATFSFNKEEGKDSHQVDIQLSPFFDKKNIYTGKAQDTDVIPLLSGSVNGIHVLGVPTKQDLDSDTSKGDFGWYALWYPKVFYMTLLVVLPIAGCGLLIYGAVKFAQRKSLDKINITEIRLQREALLRVAEVTAYKNKLDIHYDILIKDIVNGYESANIGITPKELGYFELIKQKIEGSDASYIEVLEEIKNANEDLSRSERENKLLEVDAKLKDVELHLRSAERILLRKGRLSSELGRGNQEQVRELLKDFHAKKEIVDSLGEHAEILKDLRESEETGAGGDDLEGNLEESLVEG